MSPNIWLGGIDKGHYNGNWTWTDNTSWDYNRWYSKGQGQCLRLNKYGKWSDNECEMMIPFVCKMVPADEGLQENPPNFGFIHDGSIENGHIYNGCKDSDFVVNGDIRNTNIKNDEYENDYSLVYTPCNQQMTKKGNSVDTTFIHDDLNPFKSKHNNQLANTMPSFPNNSTSE